MYFMISHFYIVVFLQHEPISRVIPFEDLRFRRVMESFRLPVFDDPRKKRLTQFVVGTIEIATRHEVSSYKTTTDIIAIPFQQIYEIFANHKIDEDAYNIHYCKTTDVSIVETTDILIEKEASDYAYKTDRKQSFILMLSLYSLFS